jgi:hypothetical protein
MVVVDLSKLFAGLPRLESDSASGQQFHVITEQIATVTLIISDDGLYATKRRYSEVSFTLSGQKDVPWSKLCVSKINDRDLMTSALMIMINSFVPC